MSIINSTITNFTNSSYQPLVIKDCGQLVYSLSDKVSFNVKLVSVVMIFLIIFEWWALNRVMNGKLTHQEKQKYYGFIMTFIHSLLLFGAFYLMYWMLLAGIDF